LVRDVKPPVFLKNHLSFGRDFWTSAVARLLT
jgi:hypothetical protein